MNNKEFLDGLVRYYLGRQEANYEWDDYYHDWLHVFNYTTNEYLEGTYSGDKGSPEAIVGVDVGVDPFDPLDIEEIYGFADGENDGPDWICYGKLKDGRFFSARGGCDYTGRD